MTTILISVLSQAVASKLHGVEVEVEVIRRKGEVIELTESDVTRRVGSGPAVTTGTTANKPNRPSTSDQGPEEEPPPNEKCHCGGRNY